jgi:uncharacterized protein (UPF0332 family)
VDLKESEEMQANLNRAERSIKAARKLALEGYFDFAASRAYYGAFYAATALLLHEGMEFGKHSAVIAGIHQHFIRPGRLKTQFGKDLNWLFELRGVGDYGVTVHVPSEDAERAIEVADQFVNEVRSLLRI